MSTIRVNAIKNTNTTDGGIGIDGSGHVTIEGQALPSAGPLSNRNLIINGAMQVAQRGTSSTSSDRQTVDSFYFNFGGGIAGTQSQQSLSSGDPYNSGFRNFYRFAISTPSTAAGTYCQVVTGLEAQNVANSGWQYASAASNVTVSFWVRSSVAQTFYGQLVSKDGTSQNYIFSFALSADTWTKVTKTVPGNSSVTIDNDNGRGLELVIVPFFGTDLTDSGATVDAWQAYSGSSRVPDMTSTWANTNGATFDLTGVQLEVGSVATPFEHRSFGDELARCQRYCFKWGNTGNASNAYARFPMGVSPSSTTAFVVFSHPVSMRDTARQMVFSASQIEHYAGGSVTGSYTATIPSDGHSDTSTTVRFTGIGTLTADRVAPIRFYDDADAYALFTAEL